MIVNFIKLEEKEVNEFRLIHKKLAYYRAKKHFEDKDRLCDPQLTNSEVLMLMTISQNMSIGYKE